jgi:hypothetical protein
MRVDVCQKMFLYILCLTLKNVRTTVEKRKHSEGGICAEEVEENVKTIQKVLKRNRQLICEYNMFPAYVSHYFRSHTQRKYLS